MTSKTSRKQAKWLTKKKNRTHEILNSSQVCKVLTPSIPVTTKAIAPI